MGISSTQKKPHRILEYNNHLTNVLTVSSDKKLYNSTAQSYSVQIVSTSDYYPFGWAMPERTYSSSNYRFGYQGSEKNEEQEGSSYTTYYRQLNTRIARWTAIDPIFQPEQSPYISMDNNPIYNTDILGDSAIAKSQNEAQLVADDLNRIYEARYGVDNAFSVTDYSLETKQGGQVTYYALTANPKFDWGVDKYTKAMYGIIASDEHVIFDLLPDQDKNWLNNYGGGFTESSKKIILSMHLTDYNYGDPLTLSGFASKWTLGGVFLHEMLYHVHKLGRLEDGKMAKVGTSATVGPNIMRLYYNSKTGKPHGAGSAQNYHFRYYGDKPKRKSTTKSIGKRIVEFNKDIFNHVYGKKANNSDTDSGR